MKTNGSAYVALVLAALVGYFAYQWWFNPNRMVKARLGDIAAALSIPANEAEFAHVTRLAQLRKFATADVRVRIGKNGADLNSVIKYLEPLLADPHKWSREQINDPDTEALYFLALAGMGLKKPKYIALYQKLEHPDRAWLSMVDLLVGRWEAAGHQTRH